MKILYLADIRLPLERANGIQTMETCHALAARGHDVTLLVRPDTQTPARDPLAFYGLAPNAHLTIARVSVPMRPGGQLGQHLRRAHYLAAAFACALRGAAGGGGNKNRAPAAPDAGTHEGADTPALGEARNPTHAQVARGAQTNTDADAAPAGVALGHDVLSRDAPGPDTLDREALGGDSEGRDALDRDALGRGPLDRDASGGVAADRRVGGRHALEASGATSRGWDVVFTRDLGLASLLLRVPRGMRPPVVYESHGYAPVVSGLLPEMLSTAPKASRAKAARLAAREQRVWLQADGYVTITASLADDLVRRLGERPADAGEGDREDAGSRSGPGLGSASGTDSRSASGPDLGPNSSYGSGARSDSRSGARSKPGPVMAVVPDGVRLDPARRFAWDGPSPASLPVAVYAGHLYPWKGVDTLIAALAHAPALRARIIGGLPSEPDLARLQQHARDLGVADRVEFVGLQPPHAVAAMLLSADALVLPNHASSVSSHYTSPLKLFEYLAAGRPIVASDLPALREVLRHGENAWLTTPGDPAALAAGLTRVTSDAPLARRLARTAFDEATRYSWERRAERLEAVLVEAARSRERS